MTIYERYNVQRNKNNSKPLKDKIFEPVDNYILTIVKRKKELKNSSQIDDTINSIQKI